jgi:hypothetical protein
MILQKRPKLYPPLALLAALPAPRGKYGVAPAPTPYPTDLRRLVAAMVD